REAIAVEPHWHRESKHDRQVADDDQAERPIGEMEVLLDVRGQHRERRGVELVEEEQGEEHDEREDVDPVGDTFEAGLRPTDQGTTSPLDFAAASVADSSMSASA